MANQTERMVPLRMVPAAKLAQHAAEKLAAQPLGKSGDGSTRKAFAVAAAVVSPVDVSLALRLMVARRCYATSVKKGF